jgi:hypothetical protein
MAAIGVSFDFGYPIDPDVTRIGRISVAGHINRKAREMSLSAVQDEVIRMDFGPITSDHIREFAEATRSTQFQNTPLTFPTIFRTTEFRWLDRLRIDMHQLLHTEQEYEYFVPLREGDEPVIATRISDYRERRGLLFVTLETEVHCGGTLALRAYSAFVVRQDAGGAE